MESLSCNAEARGHLAVELLITQDRILSVFDHPDFRKYPPEELPCNCDINLRDEIYLEPYEEAFEIVRRGGEWKNPGYVTPVAVRRVTAKSIELSWYANVGDRFHEVMITLPCDQVILCIDARSWDERPSIFVKSGWLEQMHLRSHCVFGYVDAANLRAAIAQGLKLDEKLPLLREGIDRVAARYPNVSFISFADGLFLKSHWTAGYFKRGIKYTYDPESLLLIFAELRIVFRDTLGLDAYGIFTQGSNEFHGDQLLHISTSKNHVCLNSMGAPFADLLAIESAARAAAKRGVHGFSDLYLDETYYHSLRRRYEAHNPPPLTYPYMTTFAKVEAHYVCASWDSLFADLESSD